jgi:Rrf2 family protein
VSSNSRYTVAIHALLLLEGPDGGWVTSEWIAGSVNTNAVVIRRILRVLQAEGLVAVRKGARGGYRLARPGRAISLWDVYGAMREEGPFGLHASAPNPRCPIGSRIQGRLREVYGETEASMRRVLGRTTLDGLRRQLAVVR